MLDQSNDVARLSGENVADGGFIVFNDFDGQSSTNSGLTIDEISDQTIGNITFDQLGGISTIYSGEAISGSADSDLGDILVASNGFVSINNQISVGSGASDFRLIANGDIAQSANAPVFANELGIRQAAGALDSTHDLNGDSEHNIDFGAMDGELFINDVDSPVSYTHLTLPTKRIV